MESTILGAVRETRSKTFHHYLQTSDHSTRRLKKQHKKSQGNICLNIKLAIQTVRSEERSHSTLLKALQAYVLIAVFTIASQADS